MPVSVDALLNTADGPLHGDLAGRLLVADDAVEATLQHVRRAITDQEVRLDYAERTDGNPRYVGKALQGTATPAPAWTVQLPEYDAWNRLVRAQVRSGVAWDDRALGWT